MYTICYFRNIIYYSSIRIYMYRTYKLAELHLKSVENGYVESTSFFFYIFVFLSYLLIIFNRANTNTKPERTFVIMHTMG